MKRALVVAAVALAAAGCRSPGAEEERVAKQASDQTRHITVTIQQPRDEVYAFVSNPENVPRWAAGLGGSIERAGGEWVAESPMGRVKVRFAPRNDYGIVDHAVTLPNGDSVVNPMRVIARGTSASEVVFTLFRRPGVTDGAFADDARAVEKDLRTLKGLLEK